MSKPDEKLQTKITKNSPTLTRAVEVEIQATGDYKETFEELRDAVNEVLENA